MFSFLKEKMLNLLYGEKFEVITKDAKEWIAVDKAINCFPSCSIPTTIVTWNMIDINMVAAQLQPQQRWADVETAKRGIEHYIIPDIVLQFFKKGGTLEEVDNYKSVLKYGMLHGKKRRLVII